VGTLKYYLQKLRNKTVAKLNDKISLLSYAFNKPYSINLISPATAIGLPILNKATKICGILLGLSLSAFCVELIIKPLKEKYG